LPPFHIKHPKGKSFFFVTRKEKLMTRALLIFDGYCGFCTRAVQSIQRLDRRGHLEVRAWQQPETLERAGLTPEAVRTAAWLIVDGQRYRGAAAINAALGLVTGNPIFMGLYRFVLIRPLQDLAYAWIASNRSRFRGVKAFCNQEPDACMAGQTSCQLPHSQQ
jgi:predicted DCC family thiol-disulfide oxidoreductase YuxK